MSTPIQVLKKVKDGNVFSGLKLELFEMVCRNPKRTVGEIWEMYANLHPNTDRSRNELAKRISDLANYGLVKTQGRVLCPVTGRQAYRWVATGRTPTVELNDNGRKVVVSKKTEPKLRVVGSTTVSPGSGQTVEQAATLKGLLAKKQKQPRTFLGLLFAKDNTKEVEALTAAIRALEGAV